MTTKPAALSVALPYELVLGIVEDYINTHLFFVPHHVVDLDCCDREVISVGLRAAPLEPEPLPVEDAFARISRIRLEPDPPEDAEPLFVGPTSITHPGITTAQVLHMGAPATNGNGVIGGSAIVRDEDSYHLDAAPAKEDAAAPPAARPKRGQRSKATDAQREQVLDLRVKQTPVFIIAELVGLPESTVYAILYNARKDGWDDPYYRLEKARSNGSRPKATGDGEAHV